MPRAGETKPDPRTTRAASPGEFAEPGEVIVVPTGTANIASLLAGLRRCGLRPRLAESAGEIERAARAALPGVGTLAAARAALDRRGFTDALRERVAAGRPTLAVCLGLQLLGAGSEESPEVEGLGLWNASARRFPSDVRVPQLGWNAIEPDAGCRLLQPGYAYFANSYRLTEAPAGWNVAWSDHGGRFVAAVERGAVLACQFHPEISGPWGEALLRRWLAAGAELEAAG